jgi:hypothetical protein
VVSSVFNPTFTGFYANSFIKADALRLPALKEPAWDPSHVWISDKSKGMSCHVALILPRCVAEGRAVRQLNT